MFLNATVVGCSAAVVSSAVQALGITLQRQSHIMSAGLAGSAARRWRRTWLCGLILFIIANVLGSLIQIQTLPLLVLSPLQSIGLVFNSVFACLLIRGEHFTRRLAYGTLVITLGASIVAYNSGSEVPSHENDGARARLDAFLTNMASPRFLTWFLFTVALALTVGALSYNMTRHRRLQHIAGVGFGFVSGTLTAHTFLFAKALVSIADGLVLGSHADRRATASSPAIYLLVVSMLSIIGMQLTAFNIGLRYLSSLILYPLCFLIYNSVNLVNDIIFNSLLSKGQLKPLGVLWVVLGLLLVLFGVVTISYEGPQAIRLAASNAQYQDFPLYSNQHRVSSEETRDLSFEQRQIVAALKLDPTQGQEQGLGS